MKKLYFQTFLGTTISSLIILTAKNAQADLFFKKDLASIPDNLVTLEFELPDEAVPETSIGGGVRGKVQFALPEVSSTPETSIGGGVRGDVEFALPEASSAPETSIGGGVRGDVEFALPEASSTPKTSIGGGVRSDVEFALPDQEAIPENTVGSGVRGDVEFALPDQENTPKTSVATGVRGQDVPLTALVPATKHGHTVSAHPTMFAYLPPIGAKEVFFSIQDEVGNSLYYTRLTVPSTGGIISVTLPPSAPELELWKNYLWYFAPLEPGGILRPDNYAVTGWIKRVETDINEQDLVGYPVELATAYANAGIWYNTLEVLVKAQNSDPDNPNFASEWHDLLEQVELEEIRDKNIFDQLLQFTP